MSKKDFKAGLDLIFQPSTPEPQEENRSNDQRHSPEKEVRATFILSESQINTIKALAFWQRKQIKQVIQESLEMYFSQTPKDELNQALEAYNKNKIKLS